MKKTLILLAATSTIVTSLQAGKNVIPAPTEPVPVPVAAVAPLGLYLAGGFTYSKSECECKLTDGVHLEDGSTSTGKTKATTTGFNAGLGYSFNDYFAIEGKYIHTPWKDKKSTITHYGLYLKPSYPISDSFDLYALLGYGKTKCDSIDESYKGFAWGVGAEYTFGEKVEGKKKGLGLYVEYLRPLKKTGSKNITVDMINAGIKYSF